ncbi:MAG: DUF4258 domain-containing protein [Burkholderiales bacterium]|nr:DUF4258 domain-containing protein [Anaerolineae bacterium]
MTHIIRAHNIDYIVRVHALDNMRERFISDELVIKTLEEGELIEQAHGNDLCELHYFDDYFQEIVVIRVAVNEPQKAIITVIDDTRPKKE